MFCPSCNTRNQFYHNYCYYCGHKLKEDDKSMLMVKGVGRYTKRRSGNGRNWLHLKHQKRLIRC